MFVDRAKIYIKAGAGGSGCVSFLRLKGVAKGGPDGGNGGNGGSIIAEASSSVNTLADFYYHVHYRAQAGANGSSKHSAGACGADIVLKVPCGTVIRDDKSGRIIADMFYDGERKVLCEGGKGGKGNASFCTSKRRSPSFCQQGEKTEERAVRLELKTIADVGFVGFPNAGKSTLLSVITAARPKIANYPFTTLSPNLGVCVWRDASFVAADIPGLIEGASEGAGLGHYFLRHVERTRLLLIVIDMDGEDFRDPADDYKKLMTELKNYSAELAKRPMMIVANKMDGFNAEKNLAEFKKKVRGKKIFHISAALHEGLDALLDEVTAKLETLPKAEPIPYDEFEWETEDAQGFEIVKEPSGEYLVTGKLIDVMEKNVTLDDIDSFAYFQKTLRRIGVIDALKKAGAVDGDTVILSDMEFELKD